MKLTDENQIERILRTAKTIAVVGASPKPSRVSYSIMQFLLQAGYTVVPVNPAYTTILGLTCYPTCVSIPTPIDIVDIFRRSELVVPIVQDAIAARAKTVWMQSGIINTEAATLAREAGLDVVMNRCIRVDYDLFLRR